jgi:hypothetical protein
MAPAADQCQSLNQAFAEALASSRAHGARAQKTAARTVFVHISLFSFEFRLGA